MVCLRSSKYNPVLSELLCDLYYSLSTDFISWRGLYTTLLCTPYESKDGWKIAVIKYKDTFYMCEYDTDEKIKQREHESDRQKEMSYWGVKFEQCVTAGL